MALFTIVGVLVIIAVAAVIIKAKFTSETTGSDVSLYEKEATLFSNAERSFLGVLDQALGQQYRIMGKVRFADVIKVKPTSNRSAWRHAFNRIQSKHVDFVVCDPATLAVKFVIELDDASHNQPGRQERDDFMNKALLAVGIPFFRFSAKRTYTILEIQKAILATQPAGKS